MQAIKDLVCSDDPVNHQLGLMLAFTEYGKSFETFMMVLDWHSVHSIEINDWWLTSLYVNSEMQLFVKTIDKTLIYFIGNDEISFSNLHMGCFIQGCYNENVQGCIFYIKEVIDSVYLIEKELKSIYHFLTYYDII